jgi:predicted metalloprotease with PDZ domain
MKSKNILLTVCLTLSLSVAAWAQQLHYVVNLNDRSGDTFKVTVQIQGKLGKQPVIYQFASTAPGTYQVMDMGRFVRKFEALDNKGRPVEVEQVSVNQWEIKKPEKVRTVRYEIAETWDTPVQENPIYLMCGSSIGDDHVLINGQTVFGYFHGKQQAPFTIELLYPEGWKVGTALNRNEQGYWLANNYDHAVDSPILLGNLTYAKDEVGGAQIDVYTYSATGKINSTTLLSAMKDMLNAASDFLNGLPVERYTFLFHFSDKSAGAWEHSYSSEYILKEGEWNEQMKNSVLSIAAHEFFHIVTPLNIHSEIIEHFNFVKPTPSQHLWLYEGTTEWAAHMMQLRGGLIALDEFLERWGRKAYVDSRYFDSNYSLVALSLNSYTAEGQKQYSNIYYRGALVASLLDIRLLELSNGKRGLREVILELIDKYGASKPFPEDKFFDIFVEMTYPEIGDFFDRYVKNAEPLPLKEYFNKIGIDFKAEDSASPAPAFVPMEHPTEAQLRLREAWLKNLPLR